MTHGDIIIEIKSDTLSEAFSVRDFLVTCNQVLRLPSGSACRGSSRPFWSPTGSSEPPSWRSEPRDLAWPQAPRQGLGDRAGLASGTSARGSGTPLHVLLPR